MMIREREPEPDAVEDRHPYVHEHHVRGELAHPANRLGPVGRLADHFEVVFALKDQPEAHSKQWLVIHQQDPYSSGVVHSSPLFPFSCSTARTRHPPLTVRPASTVPP